MARGRKTPKPKPPSYERIDRKTDPLEVYAVLDNVLDEYRKDLEEHKCRIALAWRYGLKRNKDGQIVLGKCKKVSELDKLYADFDFVVILNTEAWKTLSEPQRKALVHHEVCHIAISTDQNGNTKKDTRGRTAFRVKKHDIEEFGDVVAVHGCYKRDLAQFVEAAVKSAAVNEPSLFDTNDANLRGSTSSTANAEPAEPAWKRFPLSTLHEHVSEGCRGLLEKLAEAVPAANLGNIDHEVEKWRDLGNGEMMAPQLRRDYAIEIHNAFKKLGYIVPPPVVKESKSPGESPKDGPLAELWREFPLDRFEKFGLTTGDIGKLAAGEVKQGTGFPLITVGDMQRFTSPFAHNPSYSRNLTDIRGIGAAAVERIQTANENFWGWWNGDGAEDFAKEKGIKLDPKPEPEADALRGGTNAEPPVIPAELAVDAPPPEPEHPDTLPMPSTNGNGKHHKKRDGKAAAVAN